MFAARRVEEAKLPFAENGIIALKGKRKPKPDCIIMSQTSTNPVLKWILIAIAVMTVIGAVGFVLYAYYPTSEYRVERVLESQGFRVGCEWHNDDKIWKRPDQVFGDSLVITSDDCRLFCQLPRLMVLHLSRCKMSDLNLDEIGNCRELVFFYCYKATRFPINELKKLMACPVVVINVESKDVDLNDSDLEDFVKFTHLQILELRFNNIGVTDACLEYFEKIPTLKYLSLMGSSITSEGVEEFQKKRPDVEVYFE